MATATAVPMAMTAEAVMMMAVTTSAVATMTAVSLVVSTIMAAVAGEMAEKRDPGGGHVLQQIHSLFQTTYSILEYAVDGNGEWWWQWWWWL